MQGIFKVIQLVCLLLERVLIIRLFAVAILGITNKPADSITYPLPDKQHFELLLIVNGLVAPSSRLHFPSAKDPKGSAKGPDVDRGNNLMFFIVAALLFIVVI